MDSNPIYKEMIDIESFKEGMRKMDELRASQQRNISFTTNSEGLRLFNEALGSYVQILRKEDYTWDLAKNELEDCKGSINLDTRCGKCKICKEHEYGKG